MHLSHTQIRSYHDDELPGDARALAAKHFENCPRCLDALAGLHADSEWVRTRLDRLDGSAPSPTAAARSRLNARLDPNKENHPMNLKPRRALTAVIASAAVLLLFLVPGVRAAAIDFLGLFRVQQIRVVQFNPANLPENLEGRLMDYETLMADQVDFSEPGDPVEVSGPAEASRLAGFAVRVPNTDAPFTLTYQPEARAAITVDLALWQPLLDEFDGGLSLPASIDGETITVHIPNSVTYLSGGCRGPAAAAAPEVRSHQVDCLALIQLPSPSIDAPADLPVDALGRVFLQFFGFSAADAARLSSQIDWATTLVIPVPSTADYDEISVNGAAGVLFTGRFDSGVSNQSLIWIDGGIVYALMLNGAYGSAEALSIAAGLR